MSSTIGQYYCSCAICTQIRNKQPKHYRYLNYARYLFACGCCLSKRMTVGEETTSSPSISDVRTSTITFRDADVTNKHCSRHRVLVKAIRPHLSKSKIQEVRRRVEDANQRWTQMSLLPAELIDLIIQNKDFLPLCFECYQNLSSLTFNLCSTCISNIVQYRNQTFNSPSNSTELPIPNPIIERTEHIDHLLTIIDYIEEESSPSNRIKSKQINIPNDVFPRQNPSNSPL